MKSGLVLKKGTGVIVLNRTLGVSDEFFTRATDFVPERCNKRSSSARASVKERH